VLAFDLGAMREMITPGRTGFLEEPGSIEQLSRRMREIIKKRDQAVAMRRYCREAYEEKYTEDVAYRRLKRIYDRARRTAEPEISVGQVQVSV
jgi:glycosyltransferase involved in cell wall biosynthesis